MKLKSVILACTALVGVVAFAGAASAANTMNVSYFEVPASGSGGDFNICCSSPPATVPDVLLGSSLLGGLPVTSSPSIVDQSPSGQILWWTPSASTGVSATGAGVLTIPFATNMFAPNSTGTNDDNFFETAILSGDITGTGVPTTLSVSSDDDAFVYLNGKYIGGNPGVHGTETANLNLGDLSGVNSLEIFYADRAHVGANLGVTVSGATIAAAPEPTTWALMLLGVGGIGAAMRMSRRKSDAASLATA